MSDENSKATENPLKQDSSSPSGPWVQFTLLQVLVWATVVNFTLILGGTAYSTFTVSSIEKRYQEAESRINESKSKYQTASDALQQQISKAAQARSDIDSLVQNFGKLEGHLSELQKEGNRQLKSITDEAREQLNELKKEKSSIDTTLHDMESEMKRTIEQDSATIRTEVGKHIRDAKEALRESQERLNVLANEITEQKIKVDVKNKEIQDLQLTANRTLEEVRETDKILKEELRKLQQSRKIDFNMVWEHSDGWLRATYVSIAALAVISPVACFGIFRRRKRS